MFYKKKENIIFRNYGDFGYISDNRNFEYNKIDDNENVIGDKIISKSGVIFLSVLKTNPQTLEALSMNINKIFSNIDIETLKNDAKVFYTSLEKEGFIISGKTVQECNEKEILDSVKDRLKNNNYPSKIIKQKTSTQQFFQDYFKGKPQLTSIHIEITSRCNERCIHCYIPNKNKIHDMSPNLFFSILEQCRNMRLLHVTISGGEPMLHDNFCQFLKKCREYNFSVSVLTNLTLLDDKIIDEIKANPLLGVQVSLYSMDPKIHDEITTVEGSFQKTKEGLLKLIKNRVPVKISCPILKQNKNCYTDVIKWAKKNKIVIGSDYEIIARYDHTTQNLNNRLSLVEIKELFIEEMKFNSTYIEKLKESAKMKKYSTPNDIVCSVGQSSICVGDNGNVYPCASWNDYIIGNIKNTSLKEIWENSDKLQYLRSLRKKDFQKCLNCPDKEFCTMCMVRNANEDPSGNPLKLNEYFCNIAKINRMLVLKSEKRGDTEDFLDSYHSTLS